MYKNRPEMMVLPPAVKAIQLWGDWNNGIKKWAEKQQKTAPNSESSSFRYLSIHIEDLVCESRDVRYDAIKRIADYVGSGASAPSYHHPPASLPVCLIFIEQIWMMTPCAVCLLKDQSSWAPMTGKGEWEKMQSRL
jgi:hypothetical protein